MQDKAPIGEDGFAIEAEQIAFDDNRALAEVAGEHDAHFIILEQAFSVGIIPRGNLLTITGKPDARIMAISALQALYERASKGEPVSLGDVRAAAAFRQQGGIADLEPGAPSPKSAGSIAIKTPKRIIAPRTPLQADYMRALAKGDLVFGVGPAGTGKTYIAVANAVNLLQAGEVERIILSRPAVEAGERIGFLPGDMKEKVDPYLRPLYDALYDMLPPEYIERRMAAGDIEIAPLAFMRGRTLARSAVILDEAQNATIGQTKMFLTRLGDGSRMMVTGDPSQSDLPASETSGLADALALLDGVEGVQITRFTSRDVVRHPLVGRIIDRYENRDKAAKNSGERPSGK